MKRAIPQQQQHTSVVGSHLAAVSALGSRRTVPDWLCMTTQASTGNAKPMALPVSVVKVRQADVPLRGEWVGTFDGYVNAQIQPQVSGYLIRQNYLEGAAGQEERSAFSD